MLKHIQYVSDIHLEFYKMAFPKIRSVAPILCLAGDIGYPNMRNYKDFLIDLHSNKNFFKIFIVAGNHEYYYQNESIEDTNRKIENIIKINNLSKISFLYNKSEFYNGHLFIGSTMWSCITDQHTPKINDFNCITDMTFDKYNLLHNTAISFIDNEITLNRNKKIIIITHHLPSYQLINAKYNKSKYTQYFASSCDHLIRPPVITWIYGHTHIPQKQLLII